MGGHFLRAPQGGLGTKGADGSTVALNWSGGGRVAQTGTVGESRVAQRPQLQEPPFALGGQGHTASL